MLKRKIDNYLQDYYKTSRNALLITGARQTGKTYSIRRYGECYKSFIEINFVEMPEAAAIKSARNSKDILLRISTLTDKELIPGKMAALSMLPSIW